MRRKNEYIVRRGYHDVLRNKRVNENTYFVIGYLLCFFVLFFLMLFELHFIKEYLIIDRVREQRIDYDAFRNFHLNQEEYEQIIKKGQELSEYSKKKGTKKLGVMNEIGYLTYKMLRSEYRNPMEEKQSIKNVHNGIIRMYDLPTFQEAYLYYNAILKDLVCFPVPVMKDSEAYVSYENSWLSPRNYGGKRGHEGCDLMDSTNTPGFFPVLSITDGIVEKKGWLPQGGYRIGIRSPHGGYFYYAHLYKYADLEEGDKVVAGDILGFMGDSGYGEEGTTGQFDTHLHLGIYVNTPSGELSVNPYVVLKLLETKKRTYPNENEKHQ